MGLAYVRFALAHPAHYRIMFGGFVASGKGPAGVADPGTDAFQVLVDAIVEQQRAGLVRADDAQQLALYIWSVVHGIAMLALDGLLPAAMDADALIRFANERLRDRNSMTAYLRLSPHPSAATAMPACMAASVSNLRALVRPTL